METDSHISGFVWDKSTFSCNLKQKHPLTLVCTECFRFSKKYWAENKMYIDPHQCQWLYGWNTYTCPDANTLRIKIPGQLVKHAVEIRHSDSIVNWSCEIL